MWPSVVFQVQLGSAGVGEGAIQVAAEMGTAFTGVEAITFEVTDVPPWGDVVGVVTTAVDALMTSLGEFIMDSGDAAEADAGEAGATFSAGGVVIVAIPELKADGEVADFAAVPAVAEGARFVVPAKVGEAATTAGIGRSAVLAAVCGAWISLIAGAAIFAGNAKGAGIGVTGGEGNTPPDFVAKRSKAIGLFRRMNRMPPAITAKTTRITAWFVFME